MAKAYVMMNCDVGAEKEVITSQKNQWHKRGSWYAWPIRRNCAN